MQLSLVRKKALTSDKVLHFCLRTIKKILLQPSTKVTYVITSYFHVKKVHAFIYPSSFWSNFFYSFTRPLRGQPVYGFLYTQVEQVAYITMNIRISFITNERENSNQQYEKFVSYIYIYVIRPSSSSTQ